MNQTEINFEMAIQIYLTEQIALLAIITNNNTNKTSSKEDAARRSLKKFLLR